MTAQGGAAVLPGGDVPMDREELRDTLASLIYGHSRRDTSDYDINAAMRSVDAHIAYLAEQAQGQTSPSKGDQVT
jgi:hypothetical protein